MLAVMIAILGDDAGYCQSAARIEQYFHADRIFCDGNPNS
jgi:hypothetical protein